MSDNRRHLLWFVGSVIAFTTALSRCADQTEYAVLNPDNTVKTVIVCSDVEMAKRSQSDGQQYIKNKDALGAATALNTAGVGYKYDSVSKSFVAPQPYPSWVLNAQTQTWQSPVPRPTDNSKFWVWNEQTMSWIGILIQVQQQQVKQ